MGITELFGKENKPEYTASFMRASNVMSIWNYGFSLTGGLRAITRKLSFQNGLVVGPSGSGKSSTIFFGSLFSLLKGGSSICVLDVDGQGFKYSSGYAHKKGYNVYCIDFSKHSDTFNPLLLCRNVTDVQKVAYLIVKNGDVESKSDPYWSTSAEMILSVFIEYLVFHVAREFCSMANLVLLLAKFAASPKKVAQKIFRANSESLTTKFMAMSSVSERTLQSSVATVRAALKVFTTPELQYCTATSTIDFAKFRQEPSVLYICLPINQVNFYASYAALLYESLFNEIMSRIPEDNELPVFCLLDELVTMRFSNAGLVWSNIRRFKGGCLGFIQDERMLELAWSTAECHAIKTNSYSKVYLPGQPLATCKQIEETLGKYTYYTDKGTERTRSLMTASEIRMLPKDKGLILVGAEPPILATMKPYYSHFLLSRRAHIAPFDRSANVISEPPLIIFDED